MKILFLIVLLLSSPAYAFDLEQMPPEQLLTSTEVSPFKNTNSWLVPELKYDTTTKVLFSYFVALQAADVITTVIALNGGGVEGNPLFGKRPKTEVLIIAKVVATTVIYVLVNKMENHKARKWTLGVLDVLTTGVVVNNLICISDN